MSNNSNNNFKEDNEKEENKRKFLNNNVNNVRNVLRLPSNKLPLIDNIICTDYDKLYDELKLEFYERIVIKNYDFINNILIFDKTNFLAQTKTEHTVKIKENNKFLLIISNQTDDIVNKETKC